MSKLNMKEIEDLFDKFQRNDVVQDERSKTLGMFIFMADVPATPKEDVFKIYDQIDNLVSQSERQGFKYGFKMGMQWAMKRRSKVLADNVTDINGFLKINNPEEIE